jgi:hypothetical protein
VLERNAMATPSARAWGVLLVALLLFVALVGLFRAFTVDDAFITYRHARNMARGLGPVMNPGERVEGVSNLPWTLVLGAMAWLGAPADAVAPWLSLVAGALCVLLAFRTGTRLAGQGGGRVAAVACAAGVPLAIWSASGMETTAAALTLLAVLDLATRPQRTARADLAVGTAIGIVAALRPEGVMFLLPALVWAARSAGPRTQRALRILVGAALVVVPLVLFRRFYYGDWVPNPVHAKAPEGLRSLGPGALYAMKLIVSFPLVFMACRLPRGKALASENGTRLARDMILMQLLFTLFVGGDHFPGYRFAATIWPLLAVLQAGASDRWGDGAQSRRPRRDHTLAWAAAGIGAVLIGWPGGGVPLAERIVTLQRLHLPPAAHAIRLAAEVRHLGVVLAALGAWMLWQRSAVRGSVAVARQAVLTLALWVMCTLVPAAFDPQVRACRTADAASRYGRVVGEWLAATYPRGTLVATNAAGSLPYYSDLPVVDMLGLTDRHIARARADARQWIGHERGDGDYVLSRRPALVILGGPEGSVEPWPFPGDVQLAASPAFHCDYTLRRAALPGFEFTYYERRDEAGRGSAPSGL